MKFFRRLRFYLIGVGLGILMVLSIFKDRSFTSWTPKNQIKSAISNTPINYDERLICQLSCLKIDTSLLKRKIVEGTINYKESDVKDQSNRTYFIELEEDNIKNVTLNISGNLLQIIELTTTDVDCECDH